MLPWWVRMRDRYIAFDVETPNHANDRMVIRTAGSHSRYSYGR